MDTSQRDKVEKALMKVSLGYTQRVKKYVKQRVIEYDPETGKKVREEEALTPVVEERHVPPSVTALLYLVNNRMPPADVSPEALLPQAARALLGKVEEQIVMQFDNGPAGVSLSCVPPVECEGGRDALGQDLDGHPGGDPL